MKKNNLTVWCADFLVDGNDIWLISGSIACLMKYNIPSKKTEVIGVLPITTIYMTSSYPHIRKFHDKIIMFPGWGHEIIYYDISNNKFDKIKFTGCDGTMPFFSNVFFKDNELICIPQRYDRIISLSSNGEIKYRHALIKDIKNFTKCQDVDMGSCCRLDDNTIIGITGTNAIFKYLITEDTVEYINIGKEDARYRMIGLSGTNIYVYDPYKRYVLISNMFDYHVKNIIYLPEKYGNVVFNKLPNGYIMLDSVTFPLVGIMDHDGRIIYEFNENSDIPCKYDYCKGIYKDDLYYNRNTCKMYSIKNNMFEELYSFALTLEDVKKIVYGAKGKSQSVRENLFVNLKTLLNQNWLG